MEKNKIKVIIDLLKFVLLIIAIILKETIFFYVLLLLFFILCIVDRIFWKCKKCGKPLPTKIFFTTVKCCPYCKKDIE